MKRVAIIGSGPTGIYTLKRLITSEQKLAISVYEETPDAGKGTPYHPAVNDRVMLANIASVEIPAPVDTLVGWLTSQSDERLQELLLERSRIGAREFYPRIVLGEYFAAQFWMLVRQGLEVGHLINVWAAHKVTDVRLGKADITLTVRRGDGSGGKAVFDHVVMATGHNWPENTEIAPGYFSSPWPASAIKRIPAVSVGILGTSLSGIDAAVSAASAHGLFIRDAQGVLTFEPRNGSSGFAMTMMSRKGLLPEADFYCPIPYDAPTICTSESVDDAIEKGSLGLLDRMYDLFRQELLASDPDYAARIGLALSTVEDIAARYFRERENSDPFAWAARNLAEARHNKESRTIVEWRYSILKMHEVIARAIPHLDVNDLKRFHKNFKTVFVDDYATVPHESIERLLAIHSAGKLTIKALGSEYEINRSPDRYGVIINIDGEQGEETLSFDAFIDATGQHALSASDLPFPSLRRQRAVNEAKTPVGGISDEYRSYTRTGGIDVDDDFRPIVDEDVCRNLYCVSVPFLLHKLPFIQGITSARDLGARVGSSIIDAAARSDLCC